MKGSTELIDKYNLKDSNNFKYTIFRQRKTTIIRQSQTNLVSFMVKYIFNKIGIYKRVQQKG